jgi:hypothetical protein
MGGLTTMPTKLSHSTQFAPQFPAFAMQNTHAHDFQQRLRDESSREHFQHGVRAKGKRRILYLELTRLKPQKVGA